MEANGFGNRQTTSESTDQQIDSIILKRRQNGLVPISRLPPEVLSSIFLYNVFNETSDGLSYKFKPGSPNCWIHVTFVCNHWRQVAFNSPQLWSFWDHGSSQWLKVFTSRAKAAPLHIRVDSPSNKSLATLVDFFRTHNVQDRIRDLHIAASYSPLKAIFDALDCKPSTSSTDNRSKIQTLCVHRSTPNKIGISRLPQSFMDRDFPHLYELVLLYCEFDWDARVFDTSILSRLKIVLEWSNRPTMTRVLSILRRQPLLERLELKFDAIPPSTKTTESSVNIQLRHLKEIQLLGRLEECMFLIRHMSYPWTSDISLYFEAPDMVNYSSETLHFLAGHYGNGDRHTDNSTTHPTSVNTAAPPSKIRFRKLVASSYGFDIITSKSELRLGADARLLVNVCAALPLAYLCEMCVEDIALTTEHWRFSVFGVFGQLEELELGGDSVPGAILALKPAGSESDQAAFQYEALDIPLPKLKRLSIRAVHFSNPAEKGFNDHGLGACLEERDKAHCHLDTLAFRDCYGLFQWDIDSYMRWANVDCQVGYNIWWLSPPYQQTSKYVYAGLATFID